MAETYLVCQNNWLSFLMKTYSLGVPAPSCSTAALAGQRRVRCCKGGQGRVRDSGEAGSELRGVSAGQETGYSAGLHQDTSQEQDDRLLHLMRAGLTRKYLRYCLCEG